MAITRAQFIQGDSSQGVVLPGQPRGVRQGAGTYIAPDGTISVNASTSTGLAKLNNPAAFNSYIWPSAAGLPNQFLSTSGAGLLSWEFPQTYVTNVATSDATLVNLQRVVASSPGLTFTLPDSPLKDWQVAISVGSFSNTFVNPNGSKIMGISDSMQLDVINSTTYFYYVNNVYGWRVSNS